LPSEQGGIPSGEGKRGWSDGGGGKTWPSSGLGKKEGLCLHSGTEKKEKGEVEKRKRTRGNHLSFSQKGRKGENTRERNLKKKGSFSSPPWRPLRRWGKGPSKHNRNPLPRGKRKNKGKEGGGSRLQRGAEQVESSWWEEGGGGGNHGGSESKKKKRDFPPPKGYGKTTFEWKRWVPKKLQKEMGAEEGSWR